MSITRLTRRLLADGETAVGLYRKLAHDRTGTFLLESAENGRSWSRYSFVGVRSAATLTERDGVAQTRRLGRHIRCDSLPRSERARKRQSRRWLFAH